MQNYSWPPQAYDLSLSVCFQVYMLVSHFLMKIYHIFYRKIKVRFFKCATSIPMKVFQSLSLFNLKFLVQAPVQGFVFLIHHFLSQ